MRMKAHEGTTPCQEKCTHTFLWHSSPPRQAANA